MTDLSSKDQIIGFVSLIISCIAFSLMFVPLKKLDCRDGFFVQWVQCSIVFLFGMGVNIARNLPPFNLTAAIGGVLYATGNIASVPIIKELGIGMGFLIWGSVQITVGWCIARFGMFGTHVQDPSNHAMNYAGIVLTLLSGFVFVFIKSESTQSYDVVTNVKSGGTTSVETGDGHFRRKSGEAFETTEENNYETITSVKEPKQKDLKLSSKQVKKENKESKLGFTPRKIFFIFLSVCLGLLHGGFLTPIVYVQDNDPQASDNALDYVFSHFSAAYTFSTLYFLLYAIVKKNKPFVDASLVLPSALYGVLWSIGMTLFIISNHKLSQVVSFPIATRLPAVLGALMDVFFFRAIKGPRNLVILGVGVLIAITGVLLVGLSNEV